MKLRPGTFGFVLTLLLITAAASCRSVMPERYANYNGGRISVDLPNGARNAETDIAIDKDSSVVITLPNDTSVFVGKSRSPILREDLRDKLNEVLKGKAGTDELVYIAASTFNSYGTIVEVLNDIRRQEIGHAGLLANRVRGDGPGRFAVQIPDEPDPNADLSTMKPNPLTLVVSISPDLKVRLNAQDYGGVNDLEPLSAKLAHVFRQREENFAMKPGFETRSDLPLSERIEKTLTIKANRSLKYGDLIKVIDAVKGAGAVPIVLQIDDLAP